MWLESLTGLREESRAAVHEHVVVDGEHMRSKINGAVLRHGRLETPTLDELRTSVDARASPAGEIAVTECVADVQDLHRDPANAGALFQVAS